MDLNNVMALYKTYQNFNNTTLLRMLDDGLFSKQEVALQKKSSKFYSCLSKTLQYTTWVLPVNGEIWNQTRIMLTGYLVPRDAVEELSSNLMNKE